MALRPRRLRLRVRWAIQQAAFLNHGSANTVEDCGFGAQQVTRWNRFGRLAVGRPDSVTDERVESPAEPRRSSEVLIPGQWFCLDHVRHDYPWRRTGFGCAPARSTCRR